jgi:serine protease Do
MRINRDGRERDLEVTLVDRDDINIDISATREEVIEEPVTFNLGMRLETLDSDFARRHNITADNGLLVSHVSPNSPAARAEIRPGDIIISINRTPVNTVEEYQSLIEQAESERQTLILAHVRTRMGYRFVTINTQE